MLRIENVGKQFANGFTALESVNLQVEAGEIISIVGTSGCVKVRYSELLLG